MPICTMTTHPGFRFVSPMHSLPLGRRSRFCSDMGPSLAEALTAVHSSMDPSTSSRRAMLLDVKETEGTIEVRADIPGVRKENINVDIDKNILTLRVQREEKKQSSNSEEAKDTEEEEDASASKRKAPATWHRTERSQVFVKRSIRLPETADTTAGKASYKDGVLSITFPKKAPVDTSMKLAIH